MKSKKLQKLIEENFSHKEDNDDEELEEDSLVKRSVNEILDDKIEELPNDASEFSVFKRKSFPADDFLSQHTYQGKRVTRKSLEEEAVSNESESENESVEVIRKIKKVKFADHINNEKKKNEKDEDDDDTEDDESDGNDSCVESEESDVEDESDIEDDLSDQEDLKDSSFIYSKAVRDELNDSKKGQAIRKQLNLCETLLETRITLQRMLFASNQLPKPDNYEQIWAKFSTEDRNVITDCREGIWDLFEKFLQLQCKFRGRCPEFMSSLNEQTRREYEEHLATDGPKVKRRKLSEYPGILNKMHTEVKPYRNNIIQKWNDRTKAASGKLAKNNFSAFDLPVVKQIEQIMADKERVIQRTFIKRADYKIIGEEESSEIEKLNTDFDEQIYDDDDFYHKLLRDYIERKTADCNDPTQLGRKWIKLQSLRSKMKRKIDTRKTKGRKIKYDVHPKLVNFMAPINTNSWTDNAVNELFSSIFGKDLIKS